MSRAQTRFIMIMTFPLFGSLQMAGATKPTIRDFSLDGKAD